MNKFLPVLALVLLAGCTTRHEHALDTASVRDGPPADIPVNIDAIPDAVPRFEPRTGAGNPDSYQVLGKTYKVRKSSKGYVQQGIASWYGTKFHGQRTSNGEPYDMFSMTAAHKTLPIPTYVRVTHLGNRRSIVVRINDRGPFHDNRIIDLSYVAAAKLGITKNGTGLVEIRALEPEQLPQHAAGAAPVSAVYLQIGAFNDRSNALRLKNRLAAHHLPEPRIHSAVEHDSTLYKVQLGPLESAKQAETLDKKLASIGITDIRYITEPRRD